MCAPGPLDGLDRVGCCSQSSCDKGCAGVLSLSVLNHARSSIHHSLMHKRAQAQAQAHARAHTGTGTCPRRWHRHTHSHEQQQQQQQQQQEQFQHLQHAGLQAAALSLCSAGGSRELRTPGCLSRGVHRSVDGMHDGGVGGGDGQNAVRVPKRSWEELHGCGGEGPAGTGEGGARGRGAVRAGNEWEDILKRGQGTQHMFTPDGGLEAAAGEGATGVAGDAGLCRAAPRCMLSLNATANKQVRRMHRCAPLLQRVHACRCACLCVGVWGWVGVHKCRCAYE